MSGAPAPHAERPRGFRVAGRVVGAPGLEGLLVTARGGGRQLDRTETDLDGRFELSWTDDTTELVHVAAFAQWGACLGEAAVDVGGAPSDLVFHAPEAALRAPAPELGEVSAPPTPLVSTRALERFYHAVSRAERDGAFTRRFGPIEVTGWIHLFENNLEALEHLSGRLVRGDSSVRERLLELLDGAPRLASAGGSEHPHEHGGRAEAFARANRPVDVVAAGLLLDATHADAGGTAAARAAGLYATRIDSVNRAFTAAERFLDGEIDAAEFEAVVVEAGPGEVDHHGAHDHDEAPPADAPTPEDVSIDDLAPGTRELAHCLAVLEEVGRNLASSDDLPAEVGAIDPDEACAGYDGTFSIADVPAAGALALWDGRERYELNVVGRHGASVEVRPAQPLPPGTFAVVLRPTAPSLRERLIDRAVVEDEECRPLVLQPPEVAPAEAPAALLAIVGEPTVRLTANGRERELVAPAGESVVLEWETRTETRGGVTTTLRAGDEVLMAEDAPSGRFIVRAHVPVAYTLSAEVELAGRRCGVGEATVLVRRRGGGTLTVHDRIYRPGDPVAIEVELAHPTHEGDVEVFVSSSDPAVLAETTVTVPAGSTTGTVYIRAGEREGETTLGTSTSALRDRDRDGGDELDDREGRPPFRVGRSSCVEPRYGGSWTTATITATEPGDPCPPATVLSNGGSDQLGFGGARLTDVGSSIATIPDCWNDVGEKIAACSATEAAEQAACDAAHASRVAACTVTCTGFTNCDSVQCTGFTNCGSITCTSFTNCNDFWATDPRRYTCWTARGVCVAAKAVEQAACWVARGACVAAAAVARAACVVARAACVAAAAVATAACIAGSAVVLAACKALAWTKSVACKAAAGIVAVGCTVFKVAAGLVLLAVAVVHIAVGIVLNTAAVVVGVGCGVVNAVSGALGGGPPASRTSTGLRIIGVHIAVLHTGRVLIFNYDEGTFPVTSDHPANPAAVGDSERALCVVWSPSDGTARYIPLNRNLFCSGHSFTANGELLVAGGQFRLPGLLKSIIPPSQLAPGADKDLHLFDPVGESWRRLNDMEKGRWYPTCVTMPDGKVMIASGTNAIVTQAGFDGGIQHTWKIVDPVTGEIGPDLGFNKQPIFHNYPFMLTLPSGEIFAHYKQITRFFRSIGGWRLMSAGSGGSDGGEGVPEWTQYEFSRTGPGPGTCCLLPLIPTRDPDTGAPRYPAGRILIMGGGGAEGRGEPELNEPYDLGPSTDATKTAEILDMDELPLRWRWTGRNPLTPNPTRETSPMRFRRVMPDPVLLPDGTLLVVNGAQVGQSGGFLSHLRLAGGGAPMGAENPAQAPERFDPVLETWEALCPKRVERLYHATAALLPDGRVVVAGHDGFLNMPPADTSQYEIEIFSPPYLHRGPRPTISSAPSRVAWGDAFSIGTPDAGRIATVCLIRQSSITHQTNTDQRYVGLLVDPTRGEASLTVHAPPDGGVAPPGFYMLFAVTADGIPSVARWLQVGPPSD